MHCVPPGVPVKGAHPRSAADADRGHCYPKQPSQEEQTRKSDGVCSPGVLWAPREMTSSHKGLKKRPERECSSPSHVWHESCHSSCCTLSCELSGGAIHQRQQDFLCTRPFGRGFLWTALSVFPKGQLHRPPPSVHLAPSCAVRAARIKFLSGESREARLLPFFLIHF